MCFYRGIPIDILVGAREPGIIVSDRLGVKRGWEEVEGVDILVFLPTRLRL